VQLVACSALSYAVMTHCDAVNVNKLYPSINGHPENRPGFSFLAHRFTVKRCIGNEMLYFWRNCAIRSTWIRCNAIVKWVKKCR